MWKRKFKIWELSIKNCIAVGRNSSNKKIVLYQQTLKAVWTYGIQLLLCCMKKNIIQCFQNKLPTNSVNSFWLVRNNTVTGIWKVFIIDEFQRFVRKQGDRLQFCKNVKRSSCLACLQI